MAAIHTADILTTWLGRGGPAISLEGSHEQIFFNYQHESRAQGYILDFGVTGPIERDMLICNWTKV